MKITSEAEAVSAMEKLHQCGPKTVVLSSTNLGSEGHLLCMASSVRCRKKLYSVKHSNSSLTVSFCREIELRL